MLLIDENALEDQHLWKHFDEPMQAPIDTWSTAVLPSHKRARVEPENTHPGSIKFDETTDKRLLRGSSRFRGSLRGDEGLLRGTGTFRHSGSMKRRKSKRVVDENKAGKTYALP